jgi:hypothetical protein
VFGVLNLVTVAALAEAVARNGPMRYGAAYFGRLVADSLGPGGVAAMSVALLAINILVLVSFAIGFSLTLAHATGTTPLAWVAVLLAVSLPVLWRGSLEATMATALAIGAANLGLLVAIGTLALFAAASGPPTGVAVGGPPGGTAPSVLALAFGILISAYFGHTSAANAAKVVLARDPSGRALVLGNAAAMATAIAIYAFVVGAILLAVPRAALEGFDGTALTPLAERAGPAVTVLGTVFVVLAMGLGTVLFSLTLYNQALEAVHAAGSWGGGRDIVARVLSRPAGRRVVCALPVLITFILIAWLLASGAATFAGPLALVGTLAMPLLGGLFPMLILHAARRRGEEVPAVVLGPLGHPVLVWGLSAVFLAAVALHGLVIWEGTAERLFALAAAALMVGVVVTAVRSGAFRPRAVVQVRQEGAGRPYIGVVGDGRHIGSDERLEPPERPRRIDVAFDAGDLPEVLVWAHRVTREGISEPLHGSVRDGTAEHPLAGRTTLPLAGEGRAGLRITLDEPQRASEAAAWV